MEEGNHHQQELLARLEVAQRLRHILHPLGNGAAQAPERQVELVEVSCSVDVGEDQTGSRLFRMESCIRTDHNESDLSPAVATGCCAVHCVRNADTWTRAGASSAGRLGGRARKHVESHSGSGPVRWEPSRSSSRRCTNGQKTAPMLSRVPGSVPEGACAASPVCKQQRLA